MGKSQKKRAMRRHNPMRVPDSHLSPGLAAAAESSKKKEQILPILQKMESPDASERKWACVAVSNIIQNDPSTRRLLQGKNVIGSLITSLSDNEEEVVVEAAGALRNLCIDGGYDLCAEMYNKNILVPLKIFVPKISNTLAQFLENPKSAPENAQKIVYELADNVITIFWCLSETSHKALNAINKINLVPFLMSFLGNRDKLPTSTVTSAAQCLYVLTDDNPDAINEIRPNSSYTSCLVTIAQMRDWPPSVNTGGKEDIDERTSMLKVLSSGVLRNVSPLPPLSAASTVDLENEVILPLLQPIISSTSLIKVAQNVQEIVTRQDSHLPLEKLTIKHTPRSDHKSPEELELDLIETKLRTIQLGLEILTGVCATLPDPDLPTEVGAHEGVDGDGIDGEEDPDIYMGQIDASPNTNGVFTRNVFPSLIYPLLSLIEPTPLSFPPTTSPSLHPPTTSALSSIHICAFECLNNIFLSLATSSHPTIGCDAENGKKVWKTVWMSLESVGDPNGAETGAAGGRKKLWEVGIGVLWGISIVFRSLIFPEEHYVRILMDISNAARSDDSTRVKCIGTLECLAQHPESVNTNQIIADYLLTLLPTNPNSDFAIESTLQAVSALIDIYSDETLPYDVNFRQGGYLDHLINSVEGVRRLVRGINRKNEGGNELRRRGEEVRDNLIDFIGYRRSLAF